VVLVLVQVQGRDEESLHLATAQTALSKERESTAMKKLLLQVEYGENSDEETTIARRVWREQ
jgi:hypothetical protein